jgi:predicted nuclease with TOPRIM domain
VRWCQLESDISGRINRLERELAELRSELELLERILGEVAKVQLQLSNKVDEIMNKVTEVEKNLEATRQELSGQINAVGSKVMEVEKRVSEAEKNLNDHLSQQDKVLEHNSEALLNNLMMQYVLNIIDRAASSHIVLSYLNEKPFIIIETTEYIELILISTEVSKEDLKTLNKLTEALSEYVDKEVKYKILITRVTRSETPVWLYFPHRTQ